MSKTITDEHPENKILDPDNPFAYETQTELEQGTRIDYLTEQVAILTGQHALFSVYRCGKYWKAEYRGGQKGRLNFYGDNATDCLGMVENWKGII